MKFILHFLSLEWKSFSRSASFGTNLAIKIVMAIVALLYSFVLLSMGIGLYYALKENHLDPLVQVNTFLIYYFLFDLALRFLWQKIPVMNIRPMLILPIKKSTIVHFSLGKTAFSYFNWMHLFFFLPFSVVLFIENHPIESVISWYLAMFSIVYINNFINVLFSNKDNLFGILLAIVFVLGGSQHYGYFNQLYLDAGLATKSTVAKTENLSWLNQFGTLGTFLKNDIKLIKRNKRSKTTVGMSILFLFYGFIFFNNPSQPQVMQIFAGIFVTGGFLFTFGQFVPSWDSQYYPLMMTQNISYKNYLASKWWLIVIATVISTIISSFYIYLGWEIYLTILAGAVYNIGINSHLVLYAGAYTKTPIDLTSSKGAFGDKKAFNLQTALISLPKIVLPVLLYALGKYIEGPNTGLALVAGAGLIGFALRDRVFSQIEKVYKTEKYKTIQAYKQNN